MTHPTNGHSTLLPLTDKRREQAPDIENLILETQADVDALVDENRIRTDWVHNGGPETSTTGHDDRLGARLRRSIMFSEVPRP